MKSFPSTPASKPLQQPKSPLEANEALSFAIEADFHTFTPPPVPSRGSSVSN